MSPLDLEDRYYPGWPPFMLDLMPQGHARRKLAEHLGIDPDAPGSEVQLLLRGAGAPVGNLRIKEAADAEAERLRGIPRMGVTREDILDRSELFLEVADRFALIASGSSGLQGEWPKIAMTRAKDGLWYPDPVVPDAEAAAHVIVKLLRSNDENHRLILEAEAAVGEMRHALGISQEQFARMLRLTRRQLAEIERGEANPTIETLRRIGSVFGLEVGFVVRGSGPRPTKRFPVRSRASADTASVPLTCRTRISRDRSSECPLRRGVTARQGAMASRYFPAKPFDSLQP